MINRIKTVVVKIGIIVLIIVYGRKLLITTDLDLKILGTSIVFFFIIIACYLFFGEKIKSYLPQRYVENKYFSRLSITAFITLLSYLFLLLFSLGAFTDNELAHGGFKYFLYFLTLIFLGTSVAGTTLIVKYIFRIKNSGTNE